MHLSIPVGIWKFRMSWICLKGHNTRVVTLVIWEAGDSWHCGLKKKTLKRSERERRASALTAAILRCAKRNATYRKNGSTLTLNGMEWHLRILLRKNVQILKKVFNRKGIMQKRVSFGVKIVTIWQFDLNHFRVWFLARKLLLKYSLIFRKNNYNFNKISSR